MSTSDVSGHPPVIFAITAMAEWQLIRRDEACATLAKLGDLMKDPAWADDADAITLTAEAEALVDGNLTKSQVSSTTQPEARQITTMPVSLDSP